MEEVWERDAFYNLLIKSLYFCEFVPPGCDLHKCFRSSIAFLSPLDEIGKLEDVRV